MTRGSAKSVDGAPSEAGPTSGAIVNYVQRYRRSLEARNYILKANPKPPLHHFIGLQENVLKGYISRLGDQFNLAFFGNARMEADFYVIPYSAVGWMLTEETLADDQGGRRRWMVVIRPHSFHVTHSETVDVSQYYGRRELLTAPVEPFSQTDEDENEHGIQTRKADINQRLKQSKFRRNVLMNFENRCCLSGISEPELLIASHIVPWAHRFDSRLKTSNGLCLSVLYDRLFDEGLITFGDDLRVIITPRVESLSEPLKTILRAIEGRQAAPPVKPIKPGYLRYHREVIFHKG